MLRSTESASPSVRSGWIALAAAFVIAAAWAYAAPVIGDEFVHFAQITRFLAANFSVDRDQLTTIPGYHLVVAALMWVSGTESLGAARVFNAGLGIATIGAFHLLRRHAGDRGDTLPTLQFAALPVLFPFFFLAYTDVLSLALVLLAATATLGARHVLAGILLIAAIGVRQNNVVWLGFLGMLAVAPVLAGGPTANWRAIAVRALPYLAGVALFGAFWFWNGSISLSAAQSRAHPDASLHLGNVYFALMLAGVLLPLQTLRGLREFIADARSRPWLLLLPLALLAIHAWGFEVDHPYNLMDPKWSLRNQLLQAAQGHVWLDTMIGLIATAAACGLGRLRLQPRAAQWLYPFSVLFLAASWLIETRYALIPFALWLAFRERVGHNVEMSTFVVWLAAAVWMFFSVTHGGPFL